MVIATVKIQIGVHYKSRQLAEPFKPWITSGETFFYDTTTDTYIGETPSIGTEVFQYISSLKLMDPTAVIETHCSAWLDNITHPQIWEGVIRLPKGHRDTQLSDLDFQAASDLEDHLNSIVADLKSLARY